MSNVITFNSHELAKITVAKKDLAIGTDNEFFWAYNWVFNSTCFDENGFQACCDAASISMASVIQNIEEKVPSVHQRYRDFLNQQNSNSSYQ